ncbi:MAG: pyridine nucleotide-disulfide oxidoreductase [Gammaproteobacteria bacterium]|nr:pyridine nucleotide-disulfide oxidoreductase [Gammaproteobacteria bacterium]
MTAQAQPVSSNLPATSSKAEARPRATITPITIKSNRFWVSVFTITVIVVLIAGWLSRHDNNLSGAEGTGYVLGLVGGIAMLSLLLYPLRKQWRPMSRLGAVRHWFRVHMILGVVGPVLVLFHANFSFGSLNSNLALICMLLVAGSGVVGRYMYIKIHHGLYGQRANLQELRRDLKLSKGKLSDTLHLSGRNIERLKRLEKYALKKRNLLMGVLHMPFVTIYCWRMRFTIVNSVRNELRKQAEQRGWDSQMLHDISHQALMSLSTYLKMLQSTAHFHFYERLFGLWHVIHLPLFFMLVISGFVHVFAAHSY